MADSDLQTAQDDESSSALSETSSEPESESPTTDEDHSFDHVLDAFPSSVEVASTKLCEYCQKLVDILPSIGRKRRKSGRLIIDTQIEHCHGPLALEESAESGCTLCSMFLHSIFLPGYSYSHTEIAKYVDRWKAEFGDTALPYGKIDFYYHNRTDIIPSDVYLNFQRFAGYSTELLSFPVKLRRCTQPRESPRKSLF